MKKYLLFTLEFPPAIGGVSNYYHNLVRYWGVDKVSVLSDEQKGEKKGELRNGNIFYRHLLNNWLKPKWLPAFWHLAKLKISKKIDHVIVGHILPLGTVAYYLSKILKFEYSIILHGMDFTYAISTPQKKELTLKILNKACKIICANSYTAKLVNDLKDELGAKIAIVNPGIKVSFDHNPQKVQSLKDKYALWGRVIMFSLGRLVKRKGFDKIIESMAMNLKEELDLVYILGGDGPDKKYLLKKIAKLPKETQRRIILLGKISEEEAWAWMELCDFFAMPARRINGDFEGFGIVYLEANLAGKAVIAGDSGGVRDAVIDGLNGLLVDPESIMDISRAIIKLAKHPKTRARMGEEGLKRAIDQFAWKKQIAKLNQALK